MVDINKEVRYNPETREIENVDILPCSHCGGFGEHLMMTVGEHDNIEDVKCPKWQIDEAEDEGEALSDLSRGN